MEWSWMQAISKEVFNKKYMLNEGDTSVEAVYRGVAKEIASVEKNPSEWEEKFYGEMISGRLMPAGRILANARPATNNKYYNNCYTIDIDDSMDDIYSALKDDALISATGGGVGFNISKLRPNGSSTSKGGISSGPISFLRVFNESAKIIQTGGFRRSAHIAILNIDHPDIEEFITCKQGEINKELTQFNISVGITDAFMEAVDKDKDWDLVFEEKVYKTVKAQYLYDLITENAHFHNEPGVFFLGRANADNNAPNSFTIDRTNPCLAKGTLINTPIGYKKIEDIKIRDRISTLHKNGYECVDHIEIHENYPVSKVIFSNGVEHRATEGHVYHVKNGRTNRIGKKPLSALNVGDKVQFEAIEIEGTIDESSIDYKKGLLAGILIGDGCYTEKVIDTHDIVKIATSQNDKEYNDNVVELIESLGYSIRDTIDIHKDSLTMQIIIKKGKKVLEDLGLESLYSHEKEIPDYYINNKSALAGMINGLFASDRNVFVRSGSIPMIRYKTSSKKLFHSFRRALTNLGVKCNFYYGDKDKQINGVIDGRQINRNYSVYEISICGLMMKKIIKLLPENIHPQKTKKMKEILHNYTTGGNSPWVDIVEIHRNCEVDTVYDLYCKESDTWIAEGIVQQGCGEISMPAWSLCCLSSVNFTQYVKNSFTTDAYFDFDALAKSIRIGIRFLDDVLDVTKYPIPRIEEFSKKWRRIGLGFTGYADMLAMLQIPYNSKKAQKFTKHLAQFFRDTSYKASIDLASEKGPYPEFRKEEIAESGFYKRLPEEIKESIQKNGLRNVGMNTIAPNGTISLSVGQNCSSGIEPIFSLEYNRKVRTGVSDETTTEKVFDYAWLLYQNKKIFEDRVTKVDVPEYFVTTFDIDPYAGIDIQAIWQDYIDHSISKTANLPNGFTLSRYKDLFRFAYKKGLKGITTFNPEGSISGVLSMDTKKESMPKNIEDNHAPKRPESLPCDIHEIKVNKDRHIVLCGFHEGRIYEIFVTPDVENTIDIGKYKKGFTRKVKKGVYELIVKNGEDKIIIPNIGKVFDSVYGSLSRFISMSLRHGVSLQFIVEQLQKDTGFVSFERAVSRILKKYIKDGELSTHKCEECGATLEYREGCLSCPSCGWSKCA